MNKEYVEIRLPKFLAGKNPWIFSTLALAVIAVVSTALLLVYTLNGSLNPGKSQTAVGESAVSFLNSNLNITIHLQNVSEISGLYQINVLYQNQSLPIYSTRDGKYLIQGLVPIR